MKFNKFTVLAVDTVFNILADHIALPTRLDRLCRLILSHSWLFVHLSVETSR